MIITIIGVCNTAKGQITESFESGLPTAYTATTTYTLTSGVWTGQANGVIQGTVTPCAGTKVLQLRSQTGAQITSPNITTGVGTVIFCGSGSTTSASVQVNYSTDGGSTWIAATGSPFSLGTSSATYTATVNSCAPNILIQFYRTAATVYIDNVNISTYSCGCTPPADPTGTISGTTPACTSTTLSYSLPSATTYWQTSIVGTSTANPTTSDLTVTTSGNYYVRAYDGTCWSTNSVGPYAVVLNTAVSITAHPSTSAPTICSGQSLSTLTVTATGSGLTYLWYSNTVNSNSGGTSLGVTTNTYTPSNTLIGTTYYYCVVSGASPCPSVTSNVSGAITVNNCQCPFITSALINSCQGACGEGDNEIIFMNSGDFSFTGSATNIQLQYGSYPSTTVGFTESITSNATAISNMNTAAGCGTLFVEGNGASIPADANIMIVRSTLCYNAYDWTALCGNDPIYVIFSTDISWNTGGNFTNGDDPDTLRYFKMSTAGTCLTQYSYEPNDLSGGDGAFITFPIGGGAADGYTNTGCSISAIVLPVTISRFYYEKAGNVVMLKWDVVDQNNTSRYIIEKSVDGIRYESMSPVYAVSGSGINSYFKVDETPIMGLNYYRLSSVDYDGYVHYHQTLVANMDSKSYEEVVIDYGTETITIFPKEITEGMELDIIGMTGKTLKHFSSEGLRDGFVSLNKADFSEGVYVIRLTQKHKTSTKKLIIY